MNYIPPPFKEADKLCSEIIAFLLDCGGIYCSENEHIQYVVLNSIATGQYVLYRDDLGKISHWLAYWKIAPEDIETIEDGIRPLNLTDGSVLFVVEHGNKEGRSGMTKIIKELRHRAKGMQGVFWNSKGRGIKKFMHQKGE